MQDEIFDIVDANDKVIGQEFRREVHRLGLKHRAVHILIFNQQKKVFLQKRSMVKDTFPGAWDSSSSGHLDHGESYEVSALRELKEELGFTPMGNPEEILKVEARPETGQEFLRVYYCPGEGPFELNKTEIETGGWFTVEEVNKWITDRPKDFADAFRFIWQAILPKLKARGLT